MATLVALGYPIFKAWHPTTNLPLNGGKLYTYLPGTSTWKQAYKDAEGSTAWSANPIVLDSLGEAKIFWDGEYDLELYDADDNLVWTLDGFNQQEAISATANPNNLIVNPSFEDDSDGDNFPDNWDDTTYTDGSITWVNGSNEQTHGQYGIKMASSGAGASGGGYIETSSFITLNDEYSYLFAFAIRTTLATTRNVVQIFWYDKDQVQLSVGGTTTVYDASSGNPTSWDRKEYVINPSSGARYAKIRLTGIHSSNPVTGQSTFFDDLVFYQYQDAAIQIEDNSGTSEIIFSKVNAGTLTEIAKFNSSGDFLINTNKFTVANSTGNTVIAGTLGVTGATTLTGDATFTGLLNANGGIAVDTSNFTVDGTTGAIVGASTLTLAGIANLNGGIAVDTNKFTVADGSGNTLIAGTLDVTGLSTLASVDINGGNIDSTAIGASTPSTGVFSSVDITGITDGRVPYISASGFANGNLYTDGTRIGIGIIPPTSTSLLTVYQNDSTQSYAHFVNTTTGTADSDGFTVGIDSSEQAIIYNREATDMFFATGATEALRIDGSDQGIYTSSATGGSQGSGTINVTNGLFCNSNRNTSTVILDTPELMVLGTTGAWTTVNNTTLNTASAIAAIIKVITNADSGSAATTDVGKIEVFLRKTGSGLSTGQLTQANIAEAYCSVVGQLTSNNTTNTHVVTLDTSYDFDYYINDTSSGGGSASSTFYLIGYIQEC